MIILLNFNMIILLNFNIGKPSIYSIVQYLIETFNIIYIFVYKLIKILKINTLKTDENNNILNSANFLINATKKV